MSYKRSKYFATFNKEKIKYLLINKRSQITVVFFHGFIISPFSSNVKCYFPFTRLTLIPVILVNFE